MTKVATGNSCSVASLYHPHASWHRGHLHLLPLILVAFHAMAATGYRLTELFQFLAPLPDETMSKTGKT